MKSAISLVPNPLTSEQKELTTAVTYGIPIPPKNSRGAPEGPIRRKIRTAKDGGHFLVYMTNSSHIYKAARAVGVKVEIRKLGKNKFGVWVRKPETT